MGLPLLRALRPRPLRGAPQEVGGDPEEGEALEGGAVPQLEEQVGLLKETEKEGVESEARLLAVQDGPPPPLGSPASKCPPSPPQATDRSPALETRRSRCSAGPGGCLRR